MHGGKVPVKMRKSIDSQCDGTTNGLEPAVAQIEQQLFHGVAQFYPWVPPGVQTVVTLLVGSILAHMDGMAQGERQLAALHGEQAAQTAWHGLQRRGVVSARREADVADEVARGHDGQTAAQQHSRLHDGLEVPLARKAVLTEHGKRVGAVAALRMSASNCRRL